MTPKPRPALAPRLLILIGMAVILVSVLADLPPGATAVAQLAGGCAGLGGLVWFLIASRRQA